MPDCFRHLVIYVLAFLDLHQHLRAKYPARKHHAICECTLHALFCISHKTAFGGLCRSILYDLLSLQLSGLYWLLSTCRHPTFGSLTMAESLPQVLLAVHAGHAGDV